MTEPVWIVDDDQSIRWVLQQALKGAGIDSRAFCDASVAMESFAETPPKVIVTDIRMPGQNGLQFLDHVQERMPDLPVVVMTAYSDLDTTVDSFQRGAREHLPKPFDIDEAIALIKRLMDSPLDDDLPERADPSIPSTIIGNSPQMQEVFRAIGRLSKSQLNVLITGESGTGKELVARALFANSVRSNRPFVAINAAAIPADLLESELFGHEKGAFTGANQRRIGRFEQADGGTLFLDEIGDMPHDLQSRLLRVLSEGRFYRIGGVNQISVDVRVIAATNQNLEEQIELNRFRPDLYHRLNVIRIAIPPVRKRPEDIPLLVEHFFRQAAQQLNVKEKTISRDAMELLASHRWPGNVREIENVCRMATVMTPSKTVTARDIPLTLAGGDADHAPVASSHALTDWESPLRAHAKRLVAERDEDVAASLKHQFERILLEAALMESNGSRIKAARKLGWSRNTVTRKIKDLGIAS